MKRPTIMLAKQLGHCKEVTDSMYECKTIKKAINQLYTLTKVDHPKRQPKLKDDKNIIWKK